MGVLACVETLTWGRLIAGFRYLEIDLMMGKFWVIDPCINKPTSYQQHISNSVLVPVPVLPSHFPDWFWFWLTNIAGFTSCR
jgi:hypothetical protein